MIGFDDLVGGDAIVLDMAADSKEALLASLAELAARATSLPSPRILAALHDREALGTTGFGQGAAIPHARLAGLETVIAIVARLTQGVAWGALDGEPVDIAVLLLSPAGASADHLKALARVSRRLRDPAALAAMRAATGIDPMRAAIGVAATRQAA